MFVTTFRFSPITDKAQLVAALAHIHGACHKLCRQSVGLYLPVAGNIGIFSHSDDEYTRLTELQREMTDPSDQVYGKYFRLHMPVHISADHGIPQASYTHLYIRKPDPNKPQVGDLDFFMETAQFATLKISLKNDSTGIHGARTLNRPDLDLIELFDPDVDALGYVGDKKWQ